MSHLPLSPLPLSPHQLIHGRLLFQLSQSNFCHSLREPITPPVSNLKSLLLSAPVSRHFSTECLRPSSAPVHLQAPSLPAPWLSHQKPAPLHIHPAPQHLLILSGGYPILCMVSLPPFKYDDVPMGFNLRRLSHFSCLSHTLSINICFSVSPDWNVFVCSLVKGF